ncbi:NACHT domain-containing protein [Jidongwangia harbinensis]|uniref:NACHT domain-containing protein n=1 Tax=Jidongwangia harbinensis TaxID=2878561 RepID=UPI001CDA5396|nr:ATP-binding protein [Jidongwangia harbinensis]MCA2216308.1 ATP-binding protein [Jidongwangia harbinensis]MCA2217043.1 ATP-binding protein [Jidongwangia harbinensis]
MDDLPNRLAMAAVIVALGSLLFDAMSFAKGWPLAFRRLFATALIVAAATVGSLFLTSTPVVANRPPQIQFTIIAVAALAGALGVYRLVRPLRAAVDHDLRQIARAATALIEGRPLAAPLAGAGGVRRKDAFVGVDAVYRRHGREETVRAVRALVRHSRRGTDPVVLLQGPAGGGKTTIMRHVVRIALPSGRRLRRGAPIPVYVDLRRMLSDAGTVEANTIREYVADILGHGDARFRELVLQYLTERHVEVRWVFLFDSFDELPALLASSDARRVARAHLDAIRLFVDNTPESRTVIASRDFRETDVGALWPSLTVRPLSLRRQSRFVHVMITDRLARRVLRRRLAVDAGLRTLCENPLMLRLLCNYVRDTGSTELPESVFDVFDRSIRARIRETVGDHEDGQATVDRTLSTARELAFCLTAGSGTDRTSWDDIRRAMALRDFPAGETLDATALVLKLAGLGATHGARGDFLFAHRLIQDFLTAGLAMARPGLVDPDNILTEPGWENIVPFMLRHGDDELRAALLRSAESTLEKAAATAAGVPVESDLNKPADEIRRLASFAWPQPTVPLVRMIAAGRPTPVPERLQHVIDRLVVGALVGGAPYDRSVALDCLPLASSALARWAVGRTMHQETVATLRSKALDKTVALRLLPVEDDDIERPMLLLQAWRGKRSWSTRDDGSEDSLGGQLAILTAITAVSAAVVAGTAVVQRIAFPAAVPVTRALWCTAVATILWHFGCRGLGPRYPAVVAAWVVCAIGVLGLLYGTFAIGAAFIVTVYDIQRFFSSTTAHSQLWP